MGATAFHFQVRDGGWVGPLRSDHGAIPLFLRSWERNNCNEQQMETLGTILRFAYCVVTLVLHGHLLYRYAEEEDKEG